MNEQAEETVTDAQAGLDPAGVAELVESGEAELIDVRQQYEFEAGHVPGARHVEINDLTAAAGSIPKDRPVVFTCRGGSRSAMAAEAFRQGGWDAHNMTGGLSAWVEQGFALDPEDGEIAGPQPV